MPTLSCRRASTLSMSCSAAPRGDLHSIIRSKAQQTRLAAEHHNAKLGVAIFQREIKMSGFRGTEIRNFAFHPNVGVAAFHRGADGAHQVGNAPYAPRRLFAKGETELVL